MLRLAILVFFLSFMTACASAPASPSPSAVAIIPTALSTETTAPTNTLIREATAMPTEPAAVSPTTANTVTLAPSATTTPSPTATRPPATATLRPATLAPRTATNSPIPRSPTLTRPPATRVPTVPPPPPVAFVATQLLPIPAGTLKLGTPDDQQGDPDEKPQHYVDLGGFSIERYEVTNAQYQACVAAKVCPPPVKASSFTRPSYFGNPQFANYPVLNVTWTGADAYCRWLGRRLPNEAEWERAARGVNNWRYTFTNILGMPFEWNAIYHGSPLSFCEASCPLENYWGSVNDGFADTAPIGTFGYDTSDGFGVQDMGGNVSEWTSNWYDASAYTDGNDVYGPSTPTGRKVFRGGSWATEPRRNADRDSLAPDQASDRVGFRCAQ